ncbi:hypothetical protein SETIT_1G188200v2 [Setaria italica]|uniref:BHLH domain-containing protein n=1 Tax=Setaria italica TaxID=4555 RepID=K3YUG2_SETIT|nr:transcription factor bHLH95 [Setaria italica]RCV06745.1 hypothetical protein SETIT_1G188200v2 [Setaria italica]
MAQDGPHGHQDTSSSNERSFVPPTAVNFVGPAENNNGGSKIGSPVTMDAGKGKEVIPNAIQGGEHGSPSGGEANAGRSGGKNAGNGLAKGESSMAADDGNLKVNIIIERERRRKMKGMFNSLLDLMPHVPKKVDQVTLVDETINFIKSLEQTKAQLEKKKQEQVLVRQAAASSMSMPRTAHGMAALSDGWDPLPQQKPAASAAAAAGPLEFQTWSAPNVVLSVLTNDEAVINICAPRQPHMLTLVLSVLSKYKIDVTSMQVVADTAESLLTINTRVNGASGENPSAEDIYKLAVSEIVVMLSS